MSKKSLPTGIFSRSKKILATTAKIAAQEAKIRAQKKLLEVSEKTNILTKIEQAKALTQAMGELKGGAMKIGQLLSLESADVLPKEVTHILSKLQNQAPKVDNELMFEVLSKELSDHSSDLKLNQEPLASASIGQVYQGLLSDDKIVCKIQYPNIAESIETDFKLIVPMIKSFAKLSGKKANLNELFNELKSVLKDETNYINEAKNLERYQSFFSKEERYIVPKVYKKYSSMKVLTMEYVEGIPLQEWIDASPSLARRQKMADTLIQLYLKELFEYKLVQTDPNPANFLVNDKDQLILLDLGAAKILDQDFILFYKKIIQATFDADDEKMKKVFIEHGLMSEKESQRCFRAFLEMQHLSAYPFLKENQPFDFNDEDYSSRLRQSVKEFTKHVKYTSPPQQLLFLHRKLGGIFLLLKKLHIKMDLHQIWLHYLK